MILLEYQNFSSEYLAKVPIKKASLAILYFFLNFKPI